MRNLNPVSACRHCQHYVTEGRRGGQCQQLGSPVKGNWRACSLAIPPFAPTWENLNMMTAGTAMWAEPTFTRDNSDTSECEIVSVHNDVINHADHQIACVSSSEADVA